MNSRFARFTSQYPCYRLSNKVENRTAKEKWSTESINPQRIKAQQQKKNIHTQSSRYSQSHSTLPYIFDDRWIVNTTAHWTDRVCLFNTYGQYDAKKPTKKKRTRSILSIHPIIHLPIQTPVSTQLHKLSLYHPSSNRTDSHCRISESCRILSGYPKLPKTLTSSSIRAVSCDTGRKHINRSKEEGGAERRSTDRTLNSSPWKAKRRMVVRVALRGGGQCGGGCD